MEKDKEALNILRGFCTSAYNTANRSKSAGLSQKSGGFFRQVNIANTLDARRLPEHCISCGCSCAQSFTPASPSLNIWHTKARSPLKILKLRTMRIARKDFITRTSRKRMIPKKRRNGLASDTLSVQGLHRQYGGDSHTCTPDWLWTSTLNLYKPEHCHSMSFRNVPTILLPVTMWLDFIQVHSLKSGTAWKAPVFLEINSLMVLSF